jgi:hypothetical protein
MVENPSRYPWSSYGYYVGVKETPEWLTTETVLGDFAKDISKARRAYRAFVEGALGQEVSNPLKDVFASTFLGSEAFIDWAKEKWIDYKRADMRNIPALKRLKSTPSLEEIEQKVGSIIERGDPLYKKVCLYVSQQYGGYALKDIGAYYHMRGSAVSQSNRRLRGSMERDRKLKKVLKEIQNLLNVET